MHARAAAAAAAKSATAARAAAEEQVNDKSSSKTGPMQHQTRVQKHKTTNTPVQVGTQVGTL
jgi:hypothetical protein